MLKETRMKRVEDMIHAGLSNLFRSQSDLNLDQFVVSVLEGLMLIEREEYLKSHLSSGDAGNGTYLRNFKSLRTNSLQINIPRSRSGQFKPITIDLINAQKEQLYNLSLLLYRKGLSTRDISDVMEEYFGESVSRETVSNLAESFHQIRTSWENRQLDAYYKAAFCDCLFVPLKRGNSYTKEAVYVMYGVKDDNTRELLLLSVNPTEGSSVWEECFHLLQKRGVKQIDLIVADGLTGFADAAKKYYPDSDIQRCVVHLERNILNKIRPRDKAAFSHDIKEAFNNFDKDSTKEQALTKLQKVVDTWKNSYGPVIVKLTNEEFILDYLTYVDYPPEVRRMIYTTNSIENLNR